MTMRIYIYQKLITKTIYVKMTMYLLAHTLFFATESCLGSSEESAAATTGVIIEGGLEDKINLWLILNYNF